MDVARAIHKHAGDVHLHHHIGARKAVHEGGLFGNAGIALNAQPVWCFEIDEEQPHLDRKSVV